MLRELGEELQQARERRGVSIADAQAETKIRSRYLEGLEQGRFDILPGDVYTKGFLKAYAEYLGLDGRAMVERYKAWQREQAEAEEPQPAAKTKAAKTKAVKTKAAKAKAPERTPKQARAFAQAQPKLESAAPRSGSAVSRRSLYAAVLLLLVASITVGGWLALRSAGSGPAGGGEDTPGATAPTANSSGGGSQPGTGGATQPGSGGSNGGAAPSGLTLERGASDSQYILPVAIKGATGEALKLAVTARGDCWIRLERPGQATVEETLHAGDSRQWDFSGQASLKLGNPPAVSVKVNDAALADSSASYAITYVFNRP